MNLSGPFVRRPVGTSLLALAVLIAGTAAFFALPVAPLPRVDFPTVHVGASLPGTSPETMASSVATPLERRFGRIAGLSEMTSSSTSGSTDIILQFDLARGAEDAARDVQAAINASLGDLPANLPMRPSFHKINPADAPMLALAITSDTLSPGAMYDAASTLLAPKLSQIDGVGEVFVGGSQQSAVRIDVDPDRLAAAGLTPADVRIALVASNSHLPKGSFQGSHTAVTLGADDQLMGTDAYRDVVVRSSLGAPIRIRDVGEVTDSVENERSAAWFDGQRAVLLLLRRQPGANILSTIDRVQEVLPGMLATLPPGLKVQVAMNQSHTIRASIHDVERTLGLSVFLVVLVVFFFLRDVRASSIPSVAVPLSLLGTFAVMYVLDYSLDNLSLMALTISTGFVVDDAIVVTENIVQRIHRGQTPFCAALSGVQDIGFTILSITASLLAVFLPLLGMGGIVGRLFREFAVVLSAAVLVSAVVSLTVTPSMCARLLRPAPTAKKDKAKPLSDVDKGLLARLYGRALQAALRHQPLMLLVTVFTIGLSVHQYITIPKGLFPQQDNGMLMVMSEGAQDISFGSLVKKQQAVFDVLSADRAVAHSVGFISGNSGMSFVTLKSRQERQESMGRTIDRLRKSMRPIVGMRVFLQASQDLRIGGRASRTQYQLTLQDVHLDVLRHWAPEVQQALKRLPELRDVASDQQSGGVQAHLSIDRDLASRYGISMSAIDAALYDAFGQRQVTTVYGNTLPSRVVLEVAAPYRQDDDAFAHVWVRGTDELVPLLSFASLDHRPTALSVAHQGQFPSVTLSFNLATGTALGQADQAIRQALRALTLPASTRVEFQGTAQAFRVTESTMPYLIAAALVAVYIVLGVLYESLVHPVAILSTLPSAGVGALLTLRLAGEDFSVLALIGIILLIGIVKKNAIMVVDVAIVLQKKQGLPPREAIERACLERLRPILMTTAAAFLGAVPLAIGTGVGSELRRPLGLVLVGGLLVSQCVTLFTTPVVYLLLERVRKS